MTSYSQKPVPPMEKTYAPWNRKWPMGGPDWLRSSTTISSNAKSVFCTLVRLSNGKDYAYPNKQYIADDNGISVASVKRGMRELRDMGVIHVSYMNGHNSYYYFMTEAERIAAAEYRRQQQRQRELAESQEKDSEPSLLTATIRPRKVIRPGSDWTSPQGQVDPGAYPAAGSDCTEGGVRLSRGGGQTAPGHSSHEQVKRVFLKHAPTVRVTLSREEEGPVLGADPDEVSDVPASSRHHPRRDLTSGVSGRDLTSGVRTSRRRSGPNWVKAQRFLEEVRVRRLSGVSRLSATAKVEKIGLAPLAAKFASLTQAGVSDADQQRVVDLFFDRYGDYTAKGQPAWKAFLARYDALCGEIAPAEEVVYTPCNYAALRREWEAS